MYCVNCEKPVLLLALIQLRVDDLNFAYNVILEKNTQTILFTKQKYLN